MEFLNQNELTGKINLVAMFITSVLIFLLFPINVSFAGFSAYPCTSKDDCPYAILYTNRLGSTCCFVNPKGCDITCFYDYQACVEECTLPEGCVGNKYRYVHPRCDPYEGLQCYELVCEKDCDANCETDADCPPGQYCDLNDCLCKDLPTYYCCRDNTGCAVPICAKECQYGSYAGPFYGDPTCNNECKYSDCTGNPYSCSTYNNDEAKCKGAGCTWNPAQPGYCTGTRPSCSRWNADERTCTECGCSYNRYCSPVTQGADDAYCRSLSLGDCARERCCAEQGGVCRSVCINYVPGRPETCGPSDCCSLVGRCEGTAYECSVWGDTDRCTNCGCSRVSPTPSSCTGTPNPCCTYTTRSNCTTYGCTWCEGTRTGDRCYVNGIVCTNDCSLGGIEYRCSGDTRQKRTCGYYDNDPCLEWSDWQDVENCNANDGFYCTGTNRCGTETGDTKEYQDWYCDSTTVTCRYRVTSSENCWCNATDTDGLNYATKGTCTDYSGCSGGICVTQVFTDYCLDRYTLREYFVSGSGDNAICNYTDINVNSPEFKGTGWETICSSKYGILANATSFVSIDPPVVSYPGQNVTITVRFNDPDYVKGKNVSINITVKKDGTYQEWDINSNCFSRVNISASGTNQPCNWKKGTGMSSAECGADMQGDMNATSENEFFEVKAICSVPDWFPYGRRVLRVIPTYYGSSVPLASAETEFYAETETVPTITPLQKFLIFIRAILKALQDFLSFL